MGIYWGWKMETLFGLLNDWYIPIIIISFVSALLSIIISKRFMKSDNAIRLAKRLLRATVVMVLLLITIYINLAIYWLIEGIVNVLS